MRINTMRSSDCLTIALDGRLDTTAVPQLEEEMKDRLEGVRTLIFDCAGLDYISSAGLRVLLMANRAMQGKGSIRLTRVNEVVHEVLEAIGFTDFIAID